MRAIARGILAALGLGLLILAGSSSNPHAFAQQSGASDATVDGESRQPPPPIQAADAAPPSTDAERIVRLKQLIESQQRRLAESREQFDDPESEYSQAEDAFLELDKALNPS